MLNQEQQLVVEHVNGPAVVLAGAGSGKTHTLAHRVRNLISIGVDPYDILTLTFSSKAAESLTERLKQIVRLNVEAKTFHALGYRILKTFGDYGNRIELIQTYEQKKVIEDAFKHVSSGEDISSSDIMRLISLAKKDLIVPENSEKYFEDKTQDIRAEDLAYIFSEYEAYKDMNNKIDFDDMICKAIYLLRQNPEALRESRVFKYAMLDEAQDTNRSQFTLASMLIPADRMMLIGDSKQSIYAFQGARPEVVIYDFIDRHDAKVFLLNTNYRSRPHIILKANSLTEFMDERYHSDMKPVKESKDTQFNFSWFDNETEESEFVVNEILSKRGELRWKDFAVLYRTNSQSRSFEVDLIMNNIPHVIYGQDSFFLRQEVKDIIAYIKLSVDPIKYHREVLQVINIATNSFSYPTRRIGKAFVDRLIRGPRENMWDNLTKNNWPRFQALGVRDLTTFVNQLSRLPTVPEKLTHIFDNCYERYLRREGASDEDVDRTLILDEIRDVFNRFTDPGQLIAYQTKMEIFDKRSKDPDFDGVQLMTIHKAKGLEWHTVFVTGFMQGLLPHNKAIENNDLDEERRLAYVGITRAVEEIYVTGYSRKGRKAMLPSQFIPELKIQFETDSSKDVHSS